jgi:hypothetical protein
MNSDLEAIMIRQSGVFSAAQAHELGISDDELKAARRRGELIKLRRGIYTSPDRMQQEEDKDVHLVEAAGALLARHALRPGRTDPSTPPRVAVGHRSAALIWDLPSPRPPVDDGPTGPVRGKPAIGGGRRVVELIATSRRTRTYEYAVHTRPAALLASHVTTLGAIAITTLARTCVDIARESTWEEAVIVCDAALRRGVAKAELNAMLLAFPGWPGSRQALRAIAFASPLAESPAESLARVVFAEMDLPTPELQVDMYDVDGHIGRVDLLFRAQRTIVEVDGLLKYRDPNDPDALVREKIREDRLREIGWEVVRVTWAQLKGSREKLRKRILAAFARGLRRAG